MKSGATVAKNAMSAMTGMKKMAEETKTKEEKEKEERRQQQEEKDLDKAIVIDIGSKTSRVGWFHHEKPEQIQAKDTQSFGNIMAAASPKLWGSKAARDSTSLKMRLKKHRIIVTVSAVQALLFRESGHMRDGCLLKIAAESLSEYNVPGICLASSATVTGRQSI